MSEPLKLLLFYMVLSTSASAQDKIATPFYTDQGQLMYNIPFTPKEIKELRVQTIEYDQCENNTKSLADQIKDYKQVQDSLHKVVDTLTYSTINQQKIITRDSAHIATFYEVVTQWQDIDKKHIHNENVLKAQNTFLKVSTYGSLFAVAILVIKQLLF